MYDALTARKLLHAYFASSALAQSVRKIGAGTGRYSDVTASTAAPSAPPTTIRSGRRKSATERPSRRNSGLLTTSIRPQPIESCSVRALPGGTVDFTASTTGPAITRAMRRDTDVTLARSGAPSRPEGVGRQRTTTPHEVSAPSSVSKHTVPPRNPACTSSTRRGSRMSTTPCRNRSTRVTSLSTHRTEWPRCERQAAVVSPTYPAPTTPTGPADIAHLTSPVARTRRPRRRPPRCPPDRGPDAHRAGRRAGRSTTPCADVGPPADPTSAAVWARTAPPIAFRTPLPDGRFQCHRRRPAGHARSARRVRRAGTGPHAGPGHPIRRPGARRRRVRLPPDPR